MTKQFFLRYVHTGLNLQEAIDAPAWHTALASFFWQRTARPGVLVAKETASLRSPSRNCADAVITPKSDPDWSEGRLVAARGVWSPPLPTGYVERPLDTADVRTDRTRASVLDAPAWRYPMR